MVLEIECDMANNGSLLLHDTPLRGRWEWPRIKERGAAHLFSEPMIPGQILGFDFETGEAYLREPLHEDQHRAAREKLAKVMAIGPAVKPLGKKHPATMHYWIKEAIDSKCVRIVKGELPPKVDGEPQLLFKRPGNDRIDALADAVTKMADSVNKLIAAKR